MKTHASSLLILLAALTSPALGEESRFDVGARALVLLGNGTPANDMPGYGLVGSWQVREGWHVVAAIDSISFDFERPYDLLGLQSTEEIDAVNEFVRLSASVERRYPVAGKWDWYWSAGLGWAALSTGDARGLTPTGGSYDIATEADDELHLMLGAGVRWKVSRSLALGLAAHLERHDTSYVLTDRVSGATGTVGAHSPLGFSLGLQWSF